MESPLALAVAHVSLHAAYSRQRGVIGLPRFTGILAGDLPICREQRVSVSPLKQGLDLCGLPPICWKSVEPEGSSRFQRAAGAGHRRRCRLV